MNLFNFPIISNTAGFEPARAKPNGFQIIPLTTRAYVLIIERKNILC